MKDRIRFLDMFSQYEPSEEAQALLDRAVIDSAEIDPLQRRIAVDISCTEPIPMG